MRNINISPVLVMVLTAVVVGSSASRASSTNSLIMEVFKEIGKAEASRKARDNRLEVLRACKNVGCSSQDVCRILNISSALGQKACDLIPKIDEKELTRIQAINEVYGNSSHFEDIRRRCEPKAYIAGTVDLGYVSPQCHSLITNELTIISRGLKEGKVRNGSGNRHRVDRVRKVGQGGWKGVPKGVTAGVRHPNGKAYFFKGSKYFRFDFKSDRVDKVGETGKSGWRGIPKGVTAAVRHPNGKAYFFKRNKYYRFDFKSDKVDKVGETGKSGWKGVPQGITAAIRHPNGKAYFFKGSRYYRFDFESDKVDKIGQIGKSGWKGVPSSIVAAVDHPNQKSYFFNKDKYYRFVH